MSWPKDLRITQIQADTLRLLAEGHSRDSIMKETGRANHRLVKDTLTDLRRKLGVPKANWNEPASDEVLVDLIKERGMPPLYSVKVGRPLRITTVSESWPEKFGVVKANAEILELVMAGKSPEQIAKTLGRPLDKVRDRLDYIKGQMNCKGDKRGGIEKLRALLKKRGMPTVWEGAPPRSRPTKIVITARQAIYCKSALEGKTRAQIAHELNCEPAGVGEVVQALARKFEIPTGEGARNDTKDAVLAWLRINGIPPISKALNRPSGLGIRGGADKVIHEVIDLGTKAKVAPVYTPPKGLVLTIIEVVETDKEPPPQTAPASEVVVGISKMFGDKSVSIGGPMTYKDPAKGAAMAANFRKSHEGEGKITTEILRMTREAYEIAKRGLK